MYTDRIDLSIPREDLESVLTDIASATATLEFLPLLNPADRKHLAKLGLKNEGLARRIIEVGRANAGLIPRDIDFEQVDRDLLARDQLWNLRLVLQNVLGRVDGALMLTGVALYAAALEMYHCLRRKSNRPELRGIVDDLKKGFARPSRKKKQKQEPAAPLIAPAPEPVAQAPEPEPFAPEIAPKRTDPEVKIPERRVPAPSFSSQTSRPATAPLCHFLPYPLPPIFSGGFTPFALVYEHREFPQQCADVLFASCRSGNSSGPVS